MRRIIAAAAVALLGLSVAGCGAQSSGGSGGGDTVNVGIVQLPIFAPMYVAEAKGYFKDAGIKVNLQNVKSGSDAIPLASSGKLDVVLAGFSAGMFSAIHSGLDVKVVGSMGVAGPASEKPASALIVSKKAYDSGVTSVADLKGHKIGALGGPGATSAYYTSMALAEAGLKPTDVSYVDLASPDIPTGLKTGGIDAAFVSAPFWNQAVSDGIAVKLWTTPKDTSGTGVLYGGSFAKSDLAQKFFDALARGAADLQGQERYSKENLKIIGDATDQTPKQVAAVPLYHWFPDLHPLPDQLANMEKMWISVGALDYSTPTPTNDYVDSTFADNVKTQ